LEDGVRFLFTDAWHVSIASYIFNWCKYLKGWHFGNKMQLSDEWMPIWRAMEQLPIACLAQMVFAWNLPWPSDPCFGKSSCDPKIWCTRLEALWPRCPASWPVACRCSAGQLGPDLKLERLFCKASTDTPDQSSPSQHWDYKRCAMRPDVTGTHFLNLTVGARHALPSEWRPLFFASRACLRRLGHLHQRAS